MYLQIDLAINSLPLPYTFSYLHWECSRELNDGLLPYAMSPVPSPMLQKLVARMHQSFLNTNDRADIIDCVVFDL